MKIGIFFATKTKTTYKCAKLLQEQLAGSQLIEISKRNYNLSDYDFIIVASSIRMGKFHKKVKKFLKRNLNTLYNKKVGYFISNVFSSKADEIFKKNLDPRLLNRAMITKSFGGEIDLEKQKGIDKIIVKVLLKLKSFEEPKIDLKAIEDFARRVNEIGIR